MSRAVRFLAATVAAAAVVGGITGLIVQDRTDDGHVDANTSASAATPGRWYTDTGTGTDARLVTVRLPSERLAITVGTPGPQVSTVHGGEVHAPKGGSFVQITTADDRSFATYPGGVTAQPDAISVALVANGRRYPLPGPGEGNVLALAGTHPALAVTVGFAGVEQRVDLASGKRTEGSAAALYSTIPSGSARCGTPALQRPFVLTTASIPAACQVDWRRVPYLPGLGWAGAGRSWLLMSLATSGPVVVERAGRAGLRVGSTAPTTVACGSTPVKDLQDPDIGLSQHSLNGTGLVTCAVPATAPLPTVAVTETLAVYSAAGAVLGHPRLSWRVTL